MSIVVKIEGEVGTGKTSLALTFPKTLVHLDLDVGSFQRAAWRHKEEIESGGIASSSYFIPEQSVLEKLLRRPAGKIVGMKALWYQLLQDYAKALDDSRVNTVVFDSWTQAWTICTNAFLEEKQEKEPSRTRLMEVEYTEPNLRMEALLDVGRRYGKMLVLVCHMTDERRDYVDGSTGKRESVVTGKRVAEQWRRTDREVDLIINTSLRGNKPQASIVQSKLVLDLTGMVYEEPSWGAIEATVRMLRGEG